MYLYFTCSFVIRFQSGILDMYKENTFTCSSFLRNAVIPNFTCRGLSIFAEYAEGTAVSDFSAVKENLLTGVPIYYNVDIAACEDNTTQAKTFVFGQAKGANGMLLY